METGRGVRQKKEKKRDERESERMKDGEGEREEGMKRKGGRVVEREKGEK